LIVNIVRGRRAGVFLLGGCGGTHPPLLPGVPSPLLPLLIMAYLKVRPVHSFILFVRLVRSVVSFVYLVRSSHSFICLVHLVHLVRSVVSFVYLVRSSHSFIRLVHLVCLVRSSCLLIMF